MNKHYWPTIPGIKQVQVVDVSFFDRYQTTCYLYWIGTIPLRIASTQEPAAQLEVRTRGSHMHDLYGFIREAYLHYFCLCRCGYGIVPSVPFEPMKFEMSQTAMRILSLQFCHCSKSLAMRLRLLGWPLRSGRRKNRWCIKSLCSFRPNLHLHQQAWAVKEVLYFPPLKAPQNDLTANCEKTDLPICGITWCDYTARHGMVCWNRTITWQSTQHSPRGSHALAHGRTIWRRRASFQLRRTVLFWSLVRSGELAWDSWSTGHDCFNSG